MTRDEGTTAPLSHEHEHSVYVHCHECGMFGVNTPGAVSCGNCGAPDTVLYRPSCCFDAQAKLARELAEALQKALTSHDDCEFKTMTGSCASAYCCASHMVVSEDAQELLAKAREAGVIK